MCVKEKGSERESERERECVCVRAGERECVRESVCVRRNLHWGESEREAE